ncbi:acetylxylan esterase precursor [Fusarium pseudocircinatum]|uniref:Acetylxylan esterase n=1 Tax=Fusarium pseudocircinatum TaxID=56676 RepID=A0A8H5KW73_9HYPO|nr:acetylxylan esterase precursor [Fusarium pseudocircinatum]
MLGGGGGQSLGCTQQSNSALNPATSPGNKIAAVLFFGDPRHAANQAYNTGTGSPRNGGTDPGAHTSYFNVFSQEAGAWVKTKV